jgi:hypothetical protein
MASRHTSSSQGLPLDTATIPSSRLRPQAPPSQGEAAPSLDSSHGVLGLCKEGDDLRPRPIFASQTLGWFPEIVSAQVKTTLDLLLRAEDMGG